MQAHDLIIRPVITEKTTAQKGLFNQYVFEVQKDANRIEIGKAVEKIFGVQVDDVRTYRVKGKKKLRGRIPGKRRDWKRAVVSIAQGRRIEFLEGV